MPHLPDPPHLPLAQQHCRPMDGQGALGAAEIARHLATLSGWALAAGGGAVEKTYRFADFHRTIGFVNALAFIANREDHHPELALGYGHCTVRWSTHAAGGLSLNDFICAAQGDALLAGAAPPMPA